MFLVHFLFLNLTVLWFCQVAPKRLAVINSNLFLKKSIAIWPIIKMVGRLNIPGPADDITRFLEKRLSFTTRMLPPSRSTMFSIGARILGRAVDQTDIRIQINADGSAHIERKFLTLFTKGEHQAVDGGTRIGPEIKTVGGFQGLEEDHLTLELLGIARITPVEDYNVLSDHLEAAFAAGAFTKGVYITPIDERDSVQRKKKSRDP